jgi:CheY-like chemotaxis protein
MGDSEGAISKERVILFVDDEILVLMALKSQVKKNFGNKFRYEIAADSEEAWDVIRELAEDGLHLLVIISDWLMPGVRGDEFLRQVHKEYPNVKKVIISGQGDEVAIEKLREDIDLFRYIRKPWTEKELIDAISEVL